VRDRPRERIGLAIKSRPAVKEDGGKIPLSIIIFPRQGWGGLAQVVGRNRDRRLGSEQKDRRLLGRSDS